MLSKKLFRLVHQVALFAIVFASLAPSISHALQANSGAGFAQEICTTSGEKITIQVVTTKGQQLATEFSQQSSNDKTPTGIQHHLQHCPLCANSSTDAALEAPHTPIIAILTAQAQHISATLQAVLSRFSVLPPPAQAPPTLL
jgi:Protein of unknown function (DUF2946)